jgi:hypothetical protein
MHRSEIVLMPSTALPSTRERQADGVRARSEDASWTSAEAQLRACREYHASRLLLAALARRHGPLD